MNFRKAVARSIAVAIVLLPLAACGSEHEDADIDSGVVTYSHRKTVKVFEDDGETDSHRVSRSTARRCSVGERWPDCKN
jgi:hypothetical protein